MTILRLIHILSAIFWMGSTLFMGLILMPIVSRSGEEGRKLMQKLVPPVHKTMTIVGALAVLSGLRLYAFYSDNFDPAAMFRYRLPLTLGAMAGIAALLVGYFGQGSAGKKLLSLEAQMALQKQPPTPQQEAQFSSLQTRLRWGSLLEMLLMVLAVLGMTL